MMAEGELLLATVLNIVVVHIHFRGKFGIAAPSWLHDVVFLKLSRFFNLSDTVAMYQEKQQQVRISERMSGWWVGGWVGGWLGGWVVVRGS